MTREYHCRRCHVRVPDSFDADLRHVNNGFCPSCLAGRSRRQRIARAILCTLGVVFSVIAIAASVAAFVAEPAAAVAGALILATIVAFIWSIENA